MPHEYSNNVGCTEEEIKEVLLQMSVYVGFPTVLNGMFAVKEVLSARHND